MNHLVVDVILSRLDYCNSVLCRTPVVNRRSTTASPECCHTTCSGPVTTWLCQSGTSSSSRMRVIYHNWSATKQRPHPQSVAEISCHSVLSGDRIRQCETSSGSRHKDTDQCLIVAISFCRHRSVPVPCKNGSAALLPREVETWLPDCGVTH